MERCQHRHAPHCPGSRLPGGHWRMHTLTPPDSQAKAAKSMKVGVYTGILHLAPGNLSGKEHCQWRTPGCTAACLGVSTSRVQNFPNIQMARIRKTQEMDSDREAFTARLATDIETLVRNASREGKRPAVRLNGTSDDPWEAFPVTLDGVRYRNLMEAFPQVEFYDYTKSPTRVLRSLGQAPGSDRWPSNYHLTYSRSEAPGSDAMAERVLAAGGNVSVVFRGKPLPPTWHGFPVIDATAHDARFLDPPGTVAGLALLGTVKDTSGFVVDPEGQERRRGGMLVLMRPRSRSNRRAGRALTGG
jgi:hypothetical protein